MKLKSFTIALLCSAAICACTAESKPSAPHSVEDRAASILAQMTLEEKIGQIIQGDISTVTPNDLKTYNLGSVLNGGNSAPGGGKVAPAADWVALADAFWDASSDVSDGGVGVPALWGTDAVHGHNNLTEATIFPHNSALGAMHNPDLMRQIADVTAKEIRATGLDWTFAPTIAVALDDRWGRAYESYSENPDLVARYATAMIEGLQGRTGDANFLTGENVMATAKHFIGDGGTHLGIDKGDTIGDFETIMDIHGAGYNAAFEADVQTVMASFSSINGEKMHGSKHLLTDVLRDQMGFSGFVVGDWNGHGEIPGCTITDCPEALHAGLDMYMAPDSWKGLYQSLLQQAKDGDLDLNRLDEAVSRILTVKIRSGLLDAGRPSSRATSNTQVLGSDDHRAIARQAVRESLVLLKNQNDALPITPGQTVMVMGSGADSMQQQTGGWTLNWQGTGNANDEFDTGETIFHGIDQAVSNIGGSAFLSTDGTFETRPDVAIVVFGEDPYAEYRGDRSDVVFEFPDGSYAQTIKSLKAQDIPVVAVFLTGRPMWTNPIINAADAFVVAWLPGTEGGGVADTLVAGKDGKPRHDFTGRLSFSWPADGTGEPINAPEDKGVLFPYGYGLDYAHDGAQAQLPENPGVTETTAAFDGSIFARGDATSAFNLYLGDSSNARTPSTALVSKSLGGGIETRGTDYKAQEDSRTFIWSGNGTAHVMLNSKRALDLHEFGSPKNMRLSLTWRIDDHPDGPISIGMGCGDGCSGELDVTELVSNAKADTWTTTDIPVSCFVTEGLNAKNLETGLRIATAMPAEITLHSAVLKPMDKPQYSCPN